LNQACKLGPSTRAQLGARADGTDDASIAPSSPFGLQVRLGLEGHKVLLDILRNTSDARVQIEPLNLQIQTIEWATAEFKLSSGHSRRETREFFTSQMPDDDPVQTDDDPGQTR